MPSFVASDERRNARRSARQGRNMGALAGPQLMMQQAEQLEAEMSSLEALNAAMRTCARCGSRTSHSARGAAQTEKVTRPSAE